MASTISTRLMINGTAITSDPISVDYTKSNNVEAPAIETGGYDITAGGDVAIYSTPAATPTRTFLYIKNTGAVGQNFITIVYTMLCGEAATDFTVARLELGEYMYVPLAPSISVKAASSAAGTARIEYGYFSAA
tara:strand:+ start:2008 stop:2409 length:402 start_codon:yes stop_codon:yes gene_type:complete